MDKKPIRILVAGVVGEVASALCSHIAAGDMLGLDQPLILHMLDAPSNAMDMNDVKMDVMYTKYPLLEGVIATTDVVEACTDVAVVVMVGGFPRKVGVEMDVISEYVLIYKSLASALENHAAINCKVWVVPSPADRIALILKKFAPSIHRKTLPVSVDCTITGQFDGEFVTRVERLGDTHHTSAYATAWAACVLIRDWILGTPNGSCVSMGVCSDGSYNVPAGLFYSFPVTCVNGEWTIVQGSSD